MSAEERTLIETIISEADAESAEILRRIVGGKN